MDAVVELTATAGLDAVTVREVAAAAEVSIGAVQHHFATKDDLLLVAFQRVVDDTRRRVDERVALAYPTVDVAEVLSELLPLDQARAREARIYLAFAARAASNPALARMQDELLRSLRRELTQALGGPGHEIAASALLAAVDGLALHLVSGGRSLSRADARLALEAVVAGVSATAG